MTFQAGGFASKADNKVAGSSKQGKVASNAKWFKQTPELIEASISNTRPSRSKYFRTDLVREFKPRDMALDGINKFRILPPNLEIWPDAKSFGMAVWVHQSVGERFESHLCLQRMNKGACPICEESRRLIESGNASDVKLGEKIKAKSKVIFLLVDRDDEEGEVQFWASPYTKIGLALHNLQTDKEDGSIIQIVDPFEGRDILVTYNKPPKNASFTDIANVYPPNCVSLSSKVTALKNDAALEFVTKNAIPDMLVYTNYEDMQKALFGDVDRSLEEDMEDSQSDKAKTGSPSVSPSTLTLESVREMSDDGLSQVLRDNNVPESDVEDMTTAEKRKMITDNMDLS